MSRRTFESLSLELRKAKPALPQYWPQWLHDVSAVCAALSRVNKAFDAERFKADCLKS